MVANNNTLPILNFHRKDYEYWSIKMKILLMGKGFWKIVEDGYDEPTDWSTL